MATAVSICNRALGHVGIGKRITSLTQDNREARACNLYYEASRDRVLVEGQFPWARQRFTLTDIGDPPDEWSFRYSYPAGCLFIMRIEDGARVRNKVDWPDFQIETKADGSERVVLTDQDDAIAVGIGQITNEALYTPGFANALSWDLARELAFELHGDPALATAANEGYARALSAALAVDMNESREDDWRESEFVKAR